MKALHWVLLSLSSLGGLGASTPETMVAGDWSEVVGGLRGHLVFAADVEEGGTRMGVVYLELQNVSDVGNPLEIYYDINDALRCAVLDATNQEVEKAHMPANIMSPLPFWIMLPHDSTLRFRISVSGYGIPKHAGTSIGLMSGHWLIPEVARTPYFLSASFNVTPPEDKDHIHAWKGSLKLPKLKIPGNRR